MIEENIHTRSKLYHARGGDARIFGEDSDIRRKMDERQTLERFASIWQNVLEPEIRKASIITTEEAKELLEGKQKEYVINSFQFRQFSLHNVVFIARLNSEAREDGVCNQLWSLGVHRDNTRLCIYFSKIEEKERFEEIAKQLLFDDSRDLALNLIMDFVDKFAKQVSQ
jgi:hypothetical protein